jgi:SAM-dependent methyltransferase
MQPGPENTGLAWQIGVWDAMAQRYEREVDRRFRSVVEGVVQRAGLQPGEQVLDLGTGTGQVAIQAASFVGPAGQVTGVDISGEMLALARERAVALGLRNVQFRDGRAEAIPGDSSCCDVLLASLSLMYVIDRAAAAHEIARVRPGGRFVAAVWAGPTDCDIVWFQQTAGSFAPPSLVPGVGPGALGRRPDRSETVGGRRRPRRVKTAVLGFDVDDFASAWDILAGDSRRACARAPRGGESDGQARDVAER